MIHRLAPRAKLWLSFSAGLLAGLAWIAGCSDTTSPPASLPRAANAHTKVCGQVAFTVGFKRGQALARSQGKPLLVFFTLDECPFSAAMADETFAETSLARLSDRFVCVLVNADAEPEVCEQFEVRAFPAVQFVSPQGAPVAHLVGRQTSSRLMIEMQTTLQVLARRPQEPTLR